MVSPQVRIQHWEKQDNPQEHYKRQLAELKGRTQERVAESKARKSEAVMQTEKLRYLKAQEKERGTFKKRYAKTQKTVGKAFFAMFGAGGSSGQKQTQSKGNRSVGRPRAVFIHRSPLTGKPVPAQIYNKEMRFIRRRQNDIATQRQLQLQQQLAQRGITPQQAQQMELMRQLQARQVQMQPRQMPTPQVIQRPMPQQAQIQAQEMPPQRSIWNRQQGQVVQDAGLFGRRLIKTGTVESFWN